MNTTAADAARARCATAAWRNAGRRALDDVATDACTLRRHTLAAPTMSAREASLDDDNGPARPEDALRLLLRTPTPDLALAELRLVAGEVMRIEQRLDDAPAVVCPKGNVVFLWYRVAMVAARAANDNGAPPDPTLAKETSRSAEDDAAAAATKQDA